MTPKLIAAVVIIVSLAGRGFSQELLEVNYDPDETVFPNPERGTYHHKEVTSVSYANLLENELLQYRSQGVTLIMRVFYLERFVDKDISNEYLESMRRDFLIARKTGMKLLVRFAYTKEISKPVGDATPEWVLNHIDQLKDVLTENSDVIALVQAGFIGAWGEWFYTDHFSQVVGYNNEQNWLDRASVVNALLNAIPVDRTVELRTPAYKRKIAGTNDALPASEAYTGTNRSRLGHHNDCFLASPNDVGTYGANVEEEKTYIENETYFVPIGGETCGVSVPRSECPNALAEMERLHWSYINVDYHPTVVQGFETGGCMPDIEKQLGYRFRMLKGKYQAKSAPSGGMSFEIQLLNDGWANPYNPRYVEFLMRNNSSGKEYVFRTNEDPRKWSLNETVTIQQTVGLPADIEEGAYSVFINLPDPRPTLRRDAKYSIRLANQGVWEDASGYNALNTVVDVNTANASVPYAGSDFFAPLNAINNSVQPSPLLTSSSASKVLLYWGNKEDDAARVIQRSIDGGQFETIATVDGSVSSFVDIEVQPSSTYTYKYYFQLEKDISATTPQANTSTAAQNLDFENYVSNGEISEWAVVPPLATAHLDDVTYTLRLSNDRDSLNILLEGVSNKNYTVFLDTDENVSTGITNDQWEGAGFDFIVRRDSLFQAQDQSWLFVSKVSSANGPAGLEFSVSMSTFTNLGDNLRIKAAASITLPSQEHVNLPFAGRRAVNYIRILPALSPTYFTVSNSEALPESRLVISWTADCLQCKGFILERSDNASTGFVEIFRTLNERIYRNNNLELDKTYYYRMYSFNETGKSIYTVVKSGTTFKNVTGLEDPRDGVKVYPVPVDNELKIEGGSRIASVAIHNSIGQVVYSIQLIESTGSLSVDLSPLRPGMYIVWVNVDGKKTPHRILKR
jgi:hypothetical protein